MIASTLCMEEIIRWPVYVANGCMAWSRASNIKTKARSMLTKPRSKVLSISRRAKAETGEGAGGRAREVGGGYGSGTRWATPVLKVITWATLTVRIVLHYSSTRVYSHSHVHCPVGRFLHAGLAFLWLSGSILEYALHVVHRSDASTSDSPRLRTRR